MKKRSVLKYAFIASLPVMAGYVVLGIGFGIMLQSKGYSWLWALLMSLTIFAGSMQYVSVDLLASGATLITAALMTIMVNIRHLFYGITMLEKYSKMGKAKPYLIFTLTDETFSLVSNPDFPPEYDHKKFSLLVSSFDYFYWVFGSVVGGIIGATVDFDSRGIDFSMTALFIVIFVEQWEKTKQHLPALTGLIITAVCLLLFDVSIFLIPSMIGITIAMFIERKWIKEETE